MYLLGAEGKLFNQELDGTGCFDVFLFGIGCCCCFCYCYYLAAAKQTLMSVGTSSINWEPSHR